METRYSPREVEERLMREWLDRSAFHAQVDPAREPYSLVIPPPNVTGSLHMGHALNSTVQDILVRYHHLKGRNTMWLVGTDHAGIATQNKVEAQLAREGVSKEDLGREAFERRVWAWRQEYGSTILQQLKRLGCACDYERERFTMDEDYHRAVLEVFVSLYEKGDIYRGLYLVNWCPRCRSAISDLEVEHVERADKLYWVQYPVRGTGSFLTVATTRPETMFGDTAVAVHPEDPRYAHLVGREALVPLVNRPVPVIADAYVDPGFGTGALKVTPGHDPNDWEIGQRLGLPALTVIDVDGRLTQEAGEFDRMAAEQARPLVVVRLREQRLLVKEEDYVHAVGVCYRCGTTVEPLLSQQWFMNMKRLAIPAIEAVQQGRVRFVPERWGDVCLDWMYSIRPWCISRQLWWGHRLPVWYCEDCGAVIVAREDPLSCRECGGSVHQEEDVLDTWFSSALWPFATLGWPDNDPDLAYFHPTNVLSTARDIVYLWVARMMMMGLEFMGEVPFRDVLIHPTILAPDGRRMSKSLGTGVDPLELIEQYGADATRFGLIYMSSTQDVRFSAERIEMGRNFANKVWNASRLILRGVRPESHPQVERVTVADRWIFSRLGQVTDEVDALMAQYRLADIARLLYRYVWNEVCDWYLEVAKTRLYGEDEQERLQVTGNLLVLLEALMGLLHPLMPFLTEEIYQNLPQVRAGARPGSIWDSTCMLPEKDWHDSEAEAAMNAFIAVVADLRSTREEFGVPRDTVGLVYLKEHEQGRGQALMEHRDAVRGLARADIRGLVSGPDDLSGDRFTRILAPGLDAFLLLEGMIDVESERARLVAKAGKARSELERARGKLQNKLFMDKAPPDVIAEEQARLGRAEAVLAEVARQYRERIGEELP